MSSACHNDAKAKMHHEAAKSGFVNIKTGPIYSRSPVPLACSGFYGLVFVSSFISKMKEADQHIECYILL